MIAEYIIIGQGLAGTTLALQMHQAGLDVKIINHPESQNSSRVAAGIFNPITGKKNVKTWFADKIFPALFEFYPQAEKTLNARFFYPKPLYKPYDSIAEKNDNFSKTTSDELEKYLNCEPDNQLYSTFSKNPLGGFEILQTGYVDTVTYLDAAIKYFNEHNILEEVEVDWKNVNFSSDKIISDKFECKYLICCEGHHVYQNPYFNWLPFAPVIGEVLTIESQQIPENKALNKGVFVMPTQQHQARVGATYRWSYPDASKSEKAKIELCTKLEDLISVDYHVIDHQVGIRPATKYRRPFIDKHPDIDNLLIFNGFGSKGVSLIPYFANHMVSYLKNNEELEPEVRLEQYLSLYLKSE